MRFTVRRLRAVSGRGRDSRKLAKSIGESHGPQSGPYRLFFFSSDRGEPVHVHVTRERKAAKFWLQPIRLEYNRGFGVTELNKVETLVRQHEAHLVRAWHDFFKPGD